MRVEVADAIERGAERVPGRLLARRVDRDPDERAHVGLDGLVAVQVRSRQTCQRDDREAQAEQPTDHYTASHGAGSTTHHEIAMPQAPS